MAAVGFVAARGEYVSLGWRQFPVAAVGFVVATLENAGSSRVCDTLVFVGCTFGADKQRQDLSKTMYIAIWQSTIFFSM